MEKVPQIPLKQRLQSIESGKANFLAAFELFVDDILQEVLNMTGYVAAVLDCQEKVRKYESQKVMVLAEMVAVADRLPDEERKELLYSMLIIPFASMYRERRVQNGSEFYDAGHHEGDE